MSSEATDPADRLADPWTVLWLAYCAKKEEIEALEDEVERLRVANARLSEAVFEAIQSLEEWGAAEELAVGIARWRAAALADGTEATNG